MEEGTPREESDETLARRVQEGDREAFAPLFDRYEEKMLRYGRRFLAHHADVEDAVQEVFLKAYTNMQSFNINRRFSPWIYRIAHNTFINTLKDKKRDPLPFLNADTIFPHPIAPETTDRMTSERELHTALNACLDRLDAKYREPLVLYFFEEMGYRDIAEVLHVPTSTVGVRLRRGKAMLRKFYRELYPDHE